MNFKERALCGAQGFMKKYSRDKYAEMGRKSGEARRKKRDKKSKEE